MQTPKAEAGAEATRIIGLNVVGFGICCYFDADYVIAAYVLFDLRIEDILGDHFLCGASLVFLYCASFSVSRHNQKS